MKQQSFAQAEFAGKKKVTRRERFLGEMEQIVPWAALIAALKPYYFPHAGTGRGRRPIGLERMLRMYCLQQWYSLADEALEDAIYDSQALRNFVGIDLGKESVPDATTLLGFRHLLEKHDLTKTIFETVNRHLRARGLLLNKGTLTDATILAAPSSTKNKEKARDPQMHQTRKGKQWYFGMKAHIGADADSGLVHTVVGTAANVSDVTQTEHLLHGEEEIVFADAGYIGADKREALRDKPLKWHIAMKRGKLKAMAEGALKELTRRAERLKAQLRSRVEHPFHVI
jgi:IS5 family transposase